MLRLTILIFLALTACDYGSAPRIPPSSGDYVKNAGDRSTAKVFGIDFRVSASSSGASSEGVLDADLATPQKSFAEKSFTLGDDIAVTLESIDESTVHFTFNGQNFGTLNIGDQVVIDDEEKVTVNGQSRQPIDGE